MSGLVVAMKDAHKVVVGVVVAGPVSGDEHGRGALFGVAQGNLPAHVAHAS
jgi:hypothetical protein